MVEVTLYKKDGCGPTEHIKDENAYLVYVEAIGEINQEPTSQAAQVGSTMTINYCPHGWVIIEGDHITIQRHDGRGNHTGNDEYIEMKMNGGKQSEKV